MIIIPNQRLLSVYGDISMKDAYKKADDVLLNAVRSIFDLVVNRGHINLDFADLKTAMSTRGYAMMGAGLVVVKTVRVKQLNKLSVAHYLIM